MATTVHMVPTADMPKGLAADARSWTRWDGKTEVMTASCGHAGKAIKAYSGEWRDVTCMSCLRSALMRRGRISRGTPLTRDEALRMLGVKYPEQRNGVCAQCGHAGRVVRDHTRMVCADDRACGVRIREQGKAALRAALYGETPPAP